MSKGELGQPVPSSVVRRRRRFVRAIPLVLGPVSLFFPWAVVPTKFAAYVGYGGFEFFLHWLTKYPNFGPVNWEVLAGITCVIGTALVPVLFGLYYIRRRSPKFTPLSILVATAFVLYVPVIVRLDIELVTTAFAPNGTILLVFGPLCRAVAFATMAVLVARAASRSRHRKR